MVPMTMLAQAALIAKMPPAIGKLVFLGGSSFSDLLQ